MSHPQKIKLLVGFILIVASVGCGVAILYHMGQAQQTPKGQIAALPPEPNRVREENLKAQDGLSNSSLKPVCEPMKLSDLLRKAEILYDQKEKSRKEGLLWIDRKNSSFIVTLGAINGLREESTLSIYDGNQKIDVAKVDVPLDVISYVKPLNKKFLYQFDRNYYRAVLEDVK